MLLKKRNGQPVRPPIGLTQNEITSFTIDLLVATADHDNTWQPLNYIHAISTDRVLAMAWNDFRLQRAIQRLADGEKAPPIHVSRYWLYGEAYYILSDGNHRAIAARNAGHKFIMARISGEATSHLHNCYLEVLAGRLWRYIGPTSMTRATYKFISDGWTDAKADFAIAAGIKAALWR